MDWTDCFIDRSLIDLCMIDWLIDSLIEHGDQSCWRPLTYRENMQTMENCGLVL